MYNEPKIGAYYYHYKHDEDKGIFDHAYKIINIGHHTEIKGLKESAMVIYAPLYEQAGVYTEGKHYDVRPLDMFLEKVEKDGKDSPRFLEISDSDLIQKMKAKEKELYYKEI